MPAIAPGRAGRKPKGEPFTGTTKATRIRRWKRLQPGDELTAAEVAQMWIDAGGDEDDAALASVISKYESGRTVGKYNGICCWGLMQVNEEAHGARYGARGNEWDRMKKAVRIRRAAGGWGPNPWEVCHDKKCSNLLAEAAQFKTQLSEEESFGPDLTDPIGAMEEVIATVFKPVGDFFRIITDADTWMRVGKVLLGAVILLVALVSLMGGARQFARKVKPV